MVNSWQFMISFLTRLFRSHWPYQRCTFHASGRVFNSSTTSLNFLEFYLFGKIIWTFGNFWLWFCFWYLLLFELHRVIWHRIWPHKFWSFSSTVIAQLECDCSWDILKIKAVVLIPWCSNCIIRMRRVIFLRFWTFFRRFFDLISLF